MDPEQRKFLKGLYGRLSDEPLEPGSEFYEPVYSQPGWKDPITLLRTKIEFSETESMQMFSGFRGSGKTTELFRLKQDLEAQGYVVLYGDALDYLNPAQEIDISNLLIVLAGTFSDALETEQLVEIGKDSYWDRLVHYLTTTEVELGEVGLKAGAEFKLTLKTAPTFRELLRKKLETRIGELKRTVDRFFEDGIKAIRAKRGGDIPGVVFLFDQLEQIRGSLTNEQSVIHSVEPRQHLRRTRRDAPRHRALRASACSRTRDRRPARRGSCSRQSR